MDEKVRAMIDNYRWQLNGVKKPGDKGYLEPPTDYVVITRDCGIFIMSMERYRKLGVRKKAKLERGANEIYQVRWEEIENG